LSYGNYKIQIKAFNHDKIACVKPIVLNFKISTPWYLHWLTILFAISTVLFLIYKYYSNRIANIKKNNKLQEEKLQLEKEVQNSKLASIKSQMNPHFLYNALNTIQSYIYSSDKENASIYLGKFSDLTRSILDMSNKETVTLNEEIKALELYLDLEKLRFEDTLNYTIAIEDNVDTEWIHIPSMLIQPYVENAIKHGLLHKSKNRILSLSFKIEDNALHVTIDDNGIGREKSMELNKQKNKQHTSFALDANKKRLEILNHGISSNIVLKITDKINENNFSLGTKVELFIPIKN
jgi:sensor histidine kinase YesM